MNYQKGDTFKVLDHGYVTLIDWMGTDEDIIRAARMSTGRGFEGWDPTIRCNVCRALQEENHDAGCVYRLGPDLVQYEKTKGDMWLLEYLFKNRHTSPFEMCELAIEVQAPIMVFREWHRHRTQSYSEFSARYAQMPNMHYLPDKSRIKMQSKANKQGSGDVVDPEQAEIFLSDAARQQADIYDSYDNWVMLGMAKEIARLNTPVSRYSKMRAKTDLKNWLGFLSLRYDDGAQWEIRQYAQIVANIVQQLFPRTYYLFEEYMKYAVTFSRTEMEALRTLISDMEKHGTIASITPLKHLFEKLGPTRTEQFLKKLGTTGKAA